MNLNKYGKKRAGNGLGKSLLIFTLAFGGGAVLSAIITPAVAPSLTFLNITVYGTVTVLNIVVQALVSFPVFYFLLKRFKTGSLDA